MHAYRMVHGVYRTPHTAHRAAHACMERRPEAPTRAGGASGCLVCAQFEARSMTTRVGIFARCQGVVVADQWPLLRIDLRQDGCRSPFTPILLHPVIHAISHIFVPQSLMGLAHTPWAHLLTSCSSCVRSATPCATIHLRWCHVE